ncbi:MAG: membrane protein insertion efficiency factor YidD [Verrucomicrobia bacterium]|nr:membrane protein insertion efficiency factor YidD [Verrucomicrobiota bacterium]
MRKLLYLLIKFYQLAISPFLGNCCRFYPSCSDYARQALEKHGLTKGLTLTCKRLCKCHPWNKGGVDLP